MEASKYFGASLAKSHGGEKPEENDEHANAISHVSGCKDCREYFRGGEVDDEGDEGGDEVPSNMEKVTIDPDEEMKRYATALRRKGY